MGERRHARYRHRVRSASCGSVLRKWRQRRHLSQLALALKADVSQRHLSFVESGRSQPSRDFVLNVAEHLDLPLRERNRLLLTAGYAPVFPERSLNDPALTAARSAVERVLRGHEPFPALAIDRHWTLLMANRPVTALLTGISQTLLEPPVNVVRLTLHPDGLAPRIVNLKQWRQHVLERVNHSAELSGDLVLLDLVNELRGYPMPRPGLTRHAAMHDGGDVFVPFQLATDMGVLSFMSTTTVFGTPVDITLSEMALECFFPADSETAERLRALNLPGDG
ncbi:MAG: helix-turn-helix domain-containing protein [Gemmatimonadaceae bacterium]